MYELRFSLAKSSSLLNAIGHNKFVSDWDPQTIATASLENCIKLKL